MQYKKILFFVLITFITFFESKAQSNSPVKDSQLIYAPARYQIDAGLGLISYPTTGLTILLNKDLFSKKLYYFRFSNSVFFIPQFGGGIDALAFNPTFSLGYLKGNFESNLGAIFLYDYNSFLPLPYFNIGYHSDMHKMKSTAFRAGIGFPEVLYMGFQVGLSKKKKKLVYAE